MIGRIVNGVFAIAGAGGFSQFPEFYQQYTSVLFGRIKEAEIVVQDIAKQIEVEQEESGKQALARLLDLREESLETLWAHYDHLTSAGPLQKVITLAQSFDPVTAETTWRQFSPGVPATAEALAYAGVGMLIGLGLVAGGETTAKKAVGKGKRSGKTQPAQSKSTPYKDRDNPFV